MNKRFQKMSKLADDVYGISCVLKKYCEHTHEIEEISNLHPVVKHMHKDIDCLNAMFINFEEDEV